MKSITVGLLFLFLLDYPSEQTSIIYNDDSCLTQEEELLYTLIMDYRKTKGLPAIPISAKLTSVAKAHAIDLNENYVFDPGNKCNPHSWSRKGKWSACCYTDDHKEATCMWDKPKEIADYEGRGYEIAYYSSAGASAKEGLEGWQQSSGHNPLLVNSGIWSQVSWKGIGIAIYKNYGLVWFGDVADDSTVKDCK
jgi:uncharacterized protein YkwD